MTRRIRESLAFVFGLFFGRKWLHPVEQLSCEMMKTSQRNRDVLIQIQSATNGEIGVLAQSFNQVVQDLKDYQGALRKAERKYQRIFEDSKDMVYRASREGKLMDVNRAGVDLFGYENKEEMMEVRVRDAFFTLEDRKKFRNEIRNEGFVKNFETKLKRKDGAPLDVLITANAVRNGSDSVIIYEGTVRDISHWKKLEGELIQRTKELEALNEMGALINQELINMDTVFLIALEKAMSLTGFEMGAIYLLNEGEGVLEMKYHKGDSPEMVEEGKVLKCGEGVSGKTFLSKQPILVTLDEYSSFRMAPALAKEGIQSLVGFPLMVKEKAIGTITLLSRSLHELSPREINFLKSIGNQIGLALGNAQLFSNLAKAKSEWETTFDAVTDLIMIRDKDYKILNANKAVFNRFRLEPNKMIGNRCYEVLHQRATPCKPCHIFETLHSRRSISGEREHEYLKGLFQYTTFPVVNATGEVTGVVDLAREITGERRLEKEKEVVNNINKILASSLDMRQVKNAIHSELKRVLNSERMTITLLEGEGKAFRYFGLEREDDIQEPCKVAIHPDEGSPFLEAVETGQAVIVSEMEGTDSWVNRNLLLKGSRSSLIFPLEYKGRIIGTLNLGTQDPDHFSKDHVRFLQQVSAGLAISIENSLLLDEMKASEERYRIVVEGAHSGVGVLGDDYKFRYVNEKLAEITGYSREEMTGMDFRNLFGEEARSVVSERYLRRQEGKDIPSRYELNLLRKNGEKRNIEISSTMVRDSQGRLNTISFVEDITGKKKMEEQLLQTEKLRALGEMATGVAHDFNNALAAILGNTQLLLHTAQDEESKETLRTIETVAKDSAQTVRRLQDFTRKSVHRKFFKLDVNALIKDAIEITRPKWNDESQTKGILIEMISNFEQIPPVNGNASELREVIINMIFNAIEAMPGGGRIEIRTLCKMEKVLIQISDTGMGMTEEVRKKIYEPFFTTKPFTNTGLGLSMSYGVIERFGGEIEVVSRVGQGTTFTIILPIGLEGKEGKIIPAFIQRGNGTRILVIDDDESVRRVLSRILSQLDHRVTVAKDGAEGLELLREKKFDMVLTDLVMPGMSGWEVCKAVKEMSSRIPVGMITGWGMELDEREKEERGLDFIIPKPFDFKQILKVMGETMESKKKRFLS